MEASMRRGLSPILAAAILASVVLAAPGRAAERPAERTVAAAPIRFVQEPLPLKPRHSIATVAEKPPVKAARVAARTPLPLRFGRGKVIEISIARQRLTAWENRRVVMEVPISTGRPGYATPRGTYSVKLKARRWFSRDWGVWMPWAMLWHGNYFIHQLTHYPGSTQLIGANELGRPASHGCVRVGVPAAERLWRWTQTGTPVWIH
jgi:lipoprotein-anchoring transpeptidase ErfK/SrfK